MENDQTTNNDGLADASTSAPSSDSAVAVDELLVEEISIDGMCGVY